MRQPYSNDDWERFTEVFSLFGYLHPQIVEKRLESAKIRRWDIKKIWSKIWIINKIVLYAKRFSKLKPPKI
jgi:hypothetical protein